MIFSAVYYLESNNVISINCISYRFPTNVKLVVSALKNINSFMLVITYINNKRTYDHMGALYDHLVSMRIFHIDNEEVDHMQ